MSSPESTAERGPQTTKLDNGSPVIEPSKRRIIGAVAIDFSLVAVVAVVTLLIVHEQTYGNVAYSWWSALAAWILFPWLYGAFCFSGNTIGTSFMGTRIVKMKDGQAPGSFRAGWFMFFRTFILPLVPLWFVIWIIGVIGGDGAGANLDLPQYHVSVDKEATRSLYESTSGLI